MLVDIEHHIWGAKMRDDFRRAWESAGQPTGAVIGATFPRPEVVEDGIPEGDQVLAILKGSLHGRYWGVAVLTKTAIYLHGAGLVNKQKDREVLALRRITGIRVRRKVGAGWVVTITRAANTDEILRCREADAMNFSRLAQGQLDAVNSPDQSVLRSEPVAADPLDSLRKLKELHELGVINDVEYEEKRARLLSQI